MFQTVEAKLLERRTETKITWCHCSGLRRAFQQTQQAASRTMFTCQMPASGAAGLQQPGALLQQDTDVYLTSCPSRYLTHGSTYCGLRLNMCLRAKASAFTV